MLALLLLVQSFVPVVSRASNDSLNIKQESDLVKVGELDIDSYPKLDNKTILAIQKQARENKKLEKRTKGSGLFSVDSPYLPGQNPTDEEKAAAYGNLNVDFKVFGLKENGTEKEFQWNEIFGTDSNGKPGTADIYFVQRDAETNAEIHRFKLTVNKAGEYKLLDIYGKPANLPLYSTALKPYKYDVELDIGVSEKVMFLTVKLSYSGNKVASFTKDADGNIIADIPLDLQLAQIASTKFVSEWKTDVKESIRPAVNGDFDTLDNQDLRYFPFPKNDTDELKLRMESYNLETDVWPGYDPQTPPHLRVVPKVSVEEDMLEDPATYTIDKNNSRITANGKTYKYDLKYDVINGGKLTMTEIIPVTFDANGGEFASITDPAAEQKIVKEVEYEKDLSEEVEKPKKDRETFKGWATEAKGKALSDEEFNKAIKNLKAAKTFYAVWDNNDIQAEELTVNESFKDGDTWVNDFIPTLDQLKGQVKIKDASGKPQALADTDTFTIVDGETEYTTDEALKTYLYEKLKEKDNPKDEPTRIETVTAKVTHKNGTSQTVDIPIKVIKNIYEAKTLTEKPFYVPENYIKVTLDPTTKATEPQKTYFYVNPEAKVVIPGSNPTGTGDNVFTRWLMKADDASGDGTEYKLEEKPRTKFEKASTITAQYVSDVIPQPGEDKPKEVPNDFVLVEFKEGTNGSLEGTRKYWVNPKAGKKLSDIIHPTIKAADEWKDNGWNKEDTTEIKAALEVTAKYLKKVLTIEPTDQTDKDKYVKVEFDKGEHGTIADDVTKTYWVLKDVEVNLTAPTVTANEGYTQKTGDDAWSPKKAKSYSVETKHVAQYTYTGKDVIEQPGDKKPDTVPKDFVKVTIIPTDKATVDTNKIYWVAPNKEVTIPFAKPLGKEVPVSQVDPKNPKAYKWVFTKWTSDETPVRTWDKDIDTGIVGTFTKETTITAQYDKSTTEQGSVVADEITVHESFKNKNDWVNNFIETEASEAILKAAVKVIGADGKKTTLPEGSKVELLDKDGNVKSYADLAAELYDKLQEKTNEKENGIEKPYRTETVKAKVTFKNGEVQDVEIPIKVIKNIYEAKTETQRPVYVPEDYVKVTVDPTTKAEEPQKYFYYVNKEAKVVIPGKNPKAIGGFKFINWTTPGKDANGNDIDVPYKLTERHQFEKETTIRANYANEKDIIEFDPKKPVAKPEGFITVSFDADLGLKLTDIKFYHVKKNATDTNGKLLTLAALTKPKYQAANGYAFDSWDKPDTTPIGDQDIVVTALAKQASSPDKPGDEPGYRPSYPEIIYRDRIVEKEKIVEKIVKVGENDELLKEIRYMQGYNGKFRPYDGLTRAEAAQILANALKADGYRYDANYALSYTDVGNKWYTDAVRVVTQANVFQGYSDGTFRPQSKITRAEWVATLRRFQDLKEANGNAMMLRSGHWATAEVQAAYEAGWLGVYQDGTAHFDADKPITRQEVAYVSNRAFRRVLDKVYLRRSVNTLLTYKDINPSMPLYEDILCASNTLLTDNKYYKANTIVMDNVTFNIVTDYMTITQKKFQYNVNR